MERTTGMCRHCVKCPQQPQDTKHLNFHIGFEFRSSAMLVQPTGNPPTGWGFFVQEARETSTNIPLYYSPNCQYAHIWSESPQYLSSAHDRYPAIYVANHIWKCFVEFV